MAIKRALARQEISFQIFFEKLLTPVRYHRQGRIA